MKQRHTRTPAKVLIAKQLEQVRNTTQLLHAKQQIILSVIPQTPDEAAAQQAVVASNSKLISLYSQEAEHLRMTIKNWDNRQHSQQTFETTESTETDVIASEEKKIASLDQSINNRRELLVQLSEKQRKLRKSLPTKPVEVQSQIQSDISKNSAFLSSLQETISTLRSLYDRTNDSLFSLRQS